MPRVPLSLRAALLAACALARARAAPSAKRGVVAASCPAAGACDNDLALLSPGVAWSYSYNYAPTYPLDPTNRVAFVPMTWCLKDVSKAVPPGVNTSIVLAFNEPNDAHQVLSAFIRLGRAREPPRLTPAPPPPSPPLLVQHVPRGRGGRVQGPDGKVPLVEPRLARDGG